MYGSLKGTVSGQLNQRTLIEVAGVGYWVHLGTWNPSGDVTCYLYHQVREDISELFGFPTLESLALFEHLISVSGIGPKAALAILSLGSAERVAQAIHSSDLTFLSLAPGIGKRAAEKIVVELKNKTLVSETTLQASFVSDDLIAALASLGYRPQDLREQLATIPTELTKVDEKLKWFLKQQR